VIACGGTSLNCNSPSYNMRSSETTWTSAGSGTSTVSTSKIVYLNGTTDSIYFAVTPSTFSGSGGQSLITAGIEVKNAHPSQ
jgi:hypothetical protein